MNMSPYICTTIKNQHPYEKPIQSFYHLYRNHFNNGLSRFLYNNSTRLQLSGSSQEIKSSNEEDNA